MIALLTFVLCGGSFAVGQGPPRPAPVTDLPASLLVLFEFTEAGATVDDWYQLLTEWVARTSGEREVFEDEMKEFRAAIGFDLFDAAARAATGVDFSGSVRVGILQSLQDPDLLIELRVKDRESLLSFLTKLAVASDRAENTFTLLPRPGQPVGDEGAVAVSIAGDRCYIIWTQDSDAVARWLVWREQIQRNPLARDSAYDRSVAVCEPGEILTLWLPLSTLFRELGIPDIPLLEQFLGVRLSLSSDRVQWFLAMTEESPLLERSAPSRPITQFLERCPQPDLGFRINLDDPISVIEYGMMRAGAGLWLEEALAGFESRTGLDREACRRQLEGGAMGVLIYWTPEKRDNLADVMVAIRVSDREGLRQTLRVNIEDGAAEAHGANVVYALEDDLTIAIIDDHLVIGNSVDRVRERSKGTATAAKWSPSARDGEIIGIDGSTAALMKMLRGLNVAIGMSERMIMANRVLDSGSLRITAGGLLLETRPAPPVSRREWWRTLVFGTLEEVERNLAGRDSAARVAKVKSDFTTVLAACYMYKLDRGEYPTTLDPLVTGDRPYLRKIPTDPWSKKPYFFELTANGPRLISFGRDQREGGEGADADIVMGGD